MEADDLDSLIADSVGAVQSALDADNRPPAADAPAADDRSGAAVRELRRGPRDGASGASAANEELFASLVRTLQDEAFQQSMSAALRGAEPGAGAPAAAPAGLAPPPKAGAAPGADGAKGAAGDGGEGAGAEAEVEDFLKGFLQSFDKAVGSNPSFDKDFSHMMTGMLSSDLVCQPLQQLASHLEPWLQRQTGLSTGERQRYESQLGLYRRIVDVYQRSPDPLPAEEREEVQELMAKLQGLGPAPEEVLKQITPKEGERDDESFEDFMKSMGLDTGLGAAEQDLLKKLTEDPDELTKAMKEMAEGLPEDGCKQQ